jgi:hypothetical protein
MKKIKYLIIILLFISCGSDDSEEVSTDYFDIIVQESPWIYDRAEVVSIDNNGFMLNSTEIESLQNQLNEEYNIAYINSRLSFQLDNTGIYDSLGYCQNCPISWEFIEDNTFRWARLASFNYCKLINSNNQMELHWEIENLSESFVRDGILITVYYNIDLIFI